MQSGNAVRSLPGVSKADETIAELLAREPEAARILLNHGMQCAGCAIAPFETLADVCSVYAVPLEQLLEDLRSSARAQDSDLVRIRREYLEMPGLVLTLPQVARLWGFSVRRSEALLSVLVADGFLVRDETRAFRRRRGHLAKGGDSRTLVSE
jgi:hybrid cluster-associated redox disulfide protein